jgi:hypothetical protein
VKPATSWSEPIMSESTTFAEFIRSVRAGDERAARELLER